MCGIDHLVFNSEYRKEVFRTKPIEEAGQQFQVQNHVDRTKRHEYISVKKTLKEGKNKDSVYVQHSTTDINNLLTKDNEKLKHKMKHSKNLDTEEHINMKHLNHSSHSNESPITSQSRQGEIGKRSSNADSPATNPPKEKISSSPANIFTTSSLGSNYKLDRLSRESSDSSGISGDMKTDSKIKSMMEVDSCSMRKVLSPIPSARTVNSDIMIITQSNGEESPTGNGSEIDLKTFLKTEPTLNQTKSKKKSKKQKKNLKPPKAPPKSKQMAGLGIDNSGFESEIDNKFKRTLPSKRRSHESVNTLGSTDCLAGSIDTGLAGSQESLDNKSKQPEDEQCNEVLYLSPRDDEQEENCAEEENVKVFQINDRLKKSSETTENDHRESGDSANRIDNVPIADDMSCDDLEFSDLDADDEAIPESEPETDQNFSRTNSATKRPNLNIRGSAPYRSNRQKYIGMNTTVRNDRSSSNNSKING